LATTTRTKPSAAKAAQLGVEDVPLEITRENIHDAALWVARNTNRVPTYIGPTASGKTHGIHQVAEKIGAEVVTVLLGQHTPDEIAGFQLALKAADGSEQLTVANPYWFTEAQRILDEDKSVIILFDELGLSREETRGALYTFFRDRHLHGNTLNPRANREVLVYSASNPATFAPPFKSRCLFLHVPQDKGYLLSMARGNFAQKVLSVAPITHDEDPAYSNAPPPPPLVVDASASAVLNAIDDVSTGFWRLDEGAYMAVLQSLLPPQTLSEVMRERGMDASALARNYDMLVKALRALPKDNMHAMIGNVIEALPALTPTERADALAGVQDVIYDDLTADNLLIYFSTPRSDTAVEAVSKIDPEYMEKILRDKELIYVDTDSKGNHKVGGSIATRVQKMVEATAKNT
jgi:hypothetical protein